MNRKDVIICGAGPAGSSLAYFLSRGGFDVLLLDKAKFPRNKPCAGAFQVSLENFFPFSLEPVAEDKAMGLSFRERGRGCSVVVQRPIAYTVNRRKFDNFLLEQAINSGVEFIQDCPVLDIKGEDVYSKSGKFSGKIIVGAGGVSSVVRRFGRYRGIKSMMKTISADIPADFEKKLTFDFSYTDGGYAWIFPKGNITNVGLGTSPASFREGETRLFKILEDYGLPGPENIYKWTYPVFSSPERLVWKNTLLIGDAASLANPLTGGGIYNAVQSAHFASRAINLNLEKDIPLKIYQDLIKRHMYFMFYSSNVFDFLLEKAPSSILFLKTLKPFLTFLTKNLS